MEKHVDFVLLGGDLRVRAPPGSQCVAVWKKQPSPVQCRPVDQQALSPEIPTLWKHLIFMSQAPSELQRCRRGARRPALAPNRYRAATPAGQLGPRKAQPSHRERPVAISRGRDRPPKRIEAGRPTVLNRLCRIPHGHRADSGIGQRVAARSPASTRLRRLFHIG